MRERGREDIQQKIIYVWSSHDAMAMTWHVLASYYCLMLLISTVSINQISTMQHYLGGGLPLRTSACIKRTHSKRTMSPM